MEFLQDFVNDIGNNRNRKILENRLKGMTLEEAGKEFGLTRERVRQIINNLLKEKPVLKEDYFREVFETYRFSSQEFTQVFKVPESTYYYLNLLFKKGKEPLENLLTSEKIPLEIKEATKKVICENVVVIGEERVELSIKSILGYVIKNKCKKSKTIDEIFRFYQEFLKEHHLDSGTDLLINCSYIESRYDRLRHTIVGFKKRIRYYKSLEFNWDHFLEQLKWDSYQDIQISTLKLFREKFNLMKEYDIQDEYELYNLLKGLLKKNEKSAICFKKMPIIEIGTADRRKQVMDLIVEMAPVSIQDLAQKYEDKYGVRVRAVKSNILKDFDTYYQNGLYCVDVKILKREKLLQIKEKLTKRFYFMEDVNTIFQEVIGNSAVDYLNRHNLKKLGYKNNKEYIYGEEYDSAEQYLGEVYLGKEMVDLEEIDIKIIRLHAFYTILKSYREKYNLIEFSYGQYISDKRLKTLGITKTLLKDYCDQVAQFVEEGEYFTIKSLRNRGMKGLLDTLDFEDVFYSSILQVDSRFTYRRLGTAFLLRKSKEKVSLREFMIQLAEQIDQIGTRREDGVNEKLKEWYGIEVTEERW